MPTELQAQGVTRRAGAEDGIAVDAPGLRKLSGFFSESGLISTARLAVSSPRSRERLETWGGEGSPASVFAPYGVISSPT